MSFRIGLACIIAAAALSPLMALAQVAPPCCTNTKAGGAFAGGPPCCTKSNGSEVLAQNPAPPPSLQQLAYSLRDYYRDYSIDDLRSVQGALAGECSQECTPAVVTAQKVVDGLIADKLVERDRPTRPVELPRIEPAVARVEHVASPQIIIQPAPAPLPRFDEAVLRDLLSLDIPLDQVPTWLNSRLRDADARSIDSVASALAGVCLTRPCSPYLATARAALDKLAADRERAAQQRTHFGDWAVALFIGLLGACVAIFASLWQGRRQADAFRELVESVKRGPEKAPSRWASRQFRSRA